MQHYAAFYLGLHCLQKYLFRGFPSTKDLVYISFNLRSEEAQLVEHYTRDQRAACSRLIIGRVTVLCPSAA